MAESTLTVPSTSLEAFAQLKSNTSLLALPLIFSEGSLQPLTAIAYPKASGPTFQLALTQLEDVLSPKTPLYLLLRRNDALVAITFVPYLAKPELREWFLVHRRHVLKALGEEHFSSSFISKEIGEITDARSWDERDGQGRSWNDETRSGPACETCDKDETEVVSVKDLGYKKNQCRLCDRRMKYKIEDDALDALKKLANSGDCVQLSVNIITETLQLNFQDQNVSHEDVSKKLPVDRPSLTFYRHSENHLLYFIFCSPDSASVKERMKHTMALPGLVNIIAQDNGINVDQKIEIHDADDLEFVEGDERIGKFRSLYLRNQNVGTESTWSTMEADKRLLDSIR